uniref:Uncharacterized protein n=1 Tax=Glossina pallidipes TaxID=7398 RepID=A0A1B0AHK8_GLOPL
MNAMLVLMHMLTQQFNGNRFTKTSGKVKHSRQNTAGIVLTMVAQGRNSLTNLFHLRREMLTQHSQQHGCVWLIMCNPECWSSYYCTRGSSVHVMQFGMRISSTFESVISSREIGLNSLGMKSDGLNAPLLLLRGGVVPLLIHVYPSNPARSPQAAGPDVNATYLLFSKEIQIFHLLDMKRFLYGKINRVKKENVEK